MSGELKKALENAERIKKTGIKPLKVFVGWDSREDIAYQVCKQSILNHASVPVQVIPLKQQELRKRGIYWRDEDKLASTEFTFTRFLVPFLSDYEGWSLFIDCDFVFKTDIKELFDLANDKYAVMCAHHEYTPKEGVKMDGKAQTQYPRKNWSSCVLFNCGHSSNRKIDDTLVNNEHKTGAYFHRFSWLPDSQIGQFSHEWNWLTDWYDEPEDGTPKALHYTEGGPWFEEYKECKYCSDWYNVKLSYLETKNDQLWERIKLGDEKSERGLLDTTGESLHLPDQKKKLIKTAFNILKDPDGNYYDIDIKEQIMAIRGDRVAAINPGTIVDGGTDPTRKGLLFDEYLEAFVLGSPAGKLIEWTAEQEKETIPLVIRGLGKQSQLALKSCMHYKREFYYIDSGYMGNETTKSKIFHRVTKNNLQNYGPMISRDHERLPKLGYKFKPFLKTGSKILICPPSNKVMKFWGQPLAEDWTKSVTKQLKKITDREIVVRLKPKRFERISDKNIIFALQDDIHCVVTYNSIAATEALLNGIPAVALGPNAAQVLCNNSLEDIDDPYYPNLDEMLAFAAHLSYAQFTRREMQDGTAWRILNESN